MRAQKEQLSLRSCGMMRESASLSGGAGRVPTGQQCLLWKTGLSSEYFRLYESLVVLGRRRETVGNEREHENTTSEWMGTFLAKPKH